MLKKYLIILFLLFLKNANGVNLKLIYSTEAITPDLNGSYVYYLDLDSVKEISKHVFILETIQNYPPLDYAEGMVYKSFFLSEKMFITIECKLNKAKRNIIEQYSELDLNGKIVSRIDFTKNKNDGFIMKKKTNEWMISRIVCKN